MSGKKHSSGSFPDWMPANRFVRVPMSDRIVTGVIFAK
jgi:hypothetical protein